MADEIENLGIIEVRGGDASGADPRESGSNICVMQEAGGGGRVALIADGDYSGNDQFERGKRMLMDCRVSRFFVHRKEINHRVELSTESEQ